MLQAAGFTIDTDGKIKGDNIPNYFLVKTPTGTKYVSVETDGTLSSPGWDKKIPLGTTIKSDFISPNEKILTYTITDVNGNKNTVPVKVPTAGGDPTSAKWSTIKAAAISAGVNVGDVGPGGSPVTGWKYGSGDYSSGTAINDINPDPYITSGNKIGPVLTAKYSINNGSSSYYSKTSENVTYPDAKKTLQQIFNEIFNANDSAIKTTITQKNPSITNPAVNDFIEGKSTETTATRGFDGWVVRTPDGKEVIVKSSEIKNQSGAAAVSEKYPSGTTIRPNWIPQLRLDRGDGTARDLGIDFTWFEHGVIDDSTQIGDFYISNTEITRSQWKKVMSKNGTGAEADWIQMEGHKQWRAALNGVVVKNLNDTHVVPSDADMNISMDNISWYDAIMFCNQLSRIYGRTLYYELEVTEDIKNGSNVVVAKGTYAGDAFFDAINKTGLLYSPATAAAPSYNNPLWDNAIIQITKNTSNPGFRLPDSDYWRYAAHGGKIENGEWLYPTYSGTTGGKKADLEYVAWYKGNSGEKPKPVGTKGGDNPVRDMTGNVSEWCWDEYHGKTRLYIGGTYNASNPGDNDTSSYLIDAVKTPAASNIMGAMFGNGDTSASDPHQRYHAGQAGNRDTQGMRIIIPGKPGDYNF